MPDQSCFLKGVSPGCSNMFKNYKKDLEKQMKTDWSKHGPNAALCNGRRVGHCTEASRKNNYKTSNHDVVFYWNFIVWRQSHSALKDSRSRNNIVELKLLPKNKQTNLFFYPDDWEILETWISISYFTMYSHN